MTRIVRFAMDGTPRWGLAGEQEIAPLAAAPWETGGEPRPSGEARVTRRGATLLAPFGGTKILAIGRNYRAHAKELGHEVPAEPMAFLKPSTSLLPHGGTVVIPPGSGRVDYEGELTLVIGRRVKNAGRDEAAGALYGLTCAIDVSSRDWQKKDGQWWRAKGCDTFCPLGPAIVAGVPPGDLLLETRLDGVVKQSARTSDMVFDAAELISFLSRHMTLEPGDAILTGTPEGVGPIAPGQTVEVTIEKVGSLSVRVA